VLTDALDLVEKVFKQLADPPVDVVDDSADSFGILASGVVDGPVFVPLAWEGRARLATAHPNR
jgi:hypothetical protein